MADTPTPQDLANTPGIDPLAPLAPSANPPTPSAAPQSDFLKGTETTGKDTLYQDLFQKSGTGEITIGKKPKKSALEIFTNVMVYVTTISVLLTILATIHVFIKSQQDGKFMENFQYLCGYLNYDIDLPSEEKGCKTAFTLADEYQKKQSNLQSEIITQLATYIPLKVSSDLLSASKERSFVVDVYGSKVNTNDVLSMFEELRSGARFRDTDNIQCNNLAISNNDLLSSQCIVYGGNIGSVSTSTSLGSSRIESLRFIDKLADTNNSQFILQNSPTSLSTEIVKDATVSPLFITKTVLPISLRFVDNVIKN